MGQGGHNEPQGHCSEWSVQESSAKKVVCVCALFPGPGNGGRRLRLLKAGRSECRFCDAPSP